MKRVQGEGEEGGRAGGGEGPGGGKGSGGERGKGGGGEEEAGDQKGTRLARSSETITLPRND